MKYIKGIPRNELQMTCLDEAIKEDDIVRVIDVLVNQLNPKTLGYKETENKSNAGRPKFDVFTMTKLYLLGYRLGIRSGRKLEIACKYDMRFQWLLESRTPDANVINDFRKENLDYLKNMFYEFNRIYIELQILELKNVSQDGFKIKASNSKEKNYTITKLADRIKREKKNLQLGKEEIKKLEEEKNKANNFLEELEKKETLEELDKQIEEKKQELEEIEERKTRHEELVDTMKEEDVKQISLTDPESKLMKNNGTFEVCYNNQTMVDMKTHLTVAISTDDNPADVGSINTMAEIIRKEYGDKGVITDTTDKGYQSVGDINEALENGVVSQVIPQKKNISEIELQTEYEENEITKEEKNSTDRKDIKKCLRSGVIPTCYEEFIEEIKVVEEKILEDRDKETEEIELRSSEEIRETAIANQTFERDMNLNAVFCPAGEVLAQKSKRNDGKIRYANKHACKMCKNPCCKNKFKEVDFSTNQKTLVPKGNTASKPRLKRRKRVSKKIVKYKLKLNPDLLKKRMQTSEHSQGTMKTVDNYRSFSMRGKEKANAEIALYFSASNIRRICNIIPPQKIIKMVQEYFQNGVNRAIISI